MVCKLRKNCTVCNVEFETSRSRTLTCSKECSTERHSARKRKNIIRVCPICDIEFKGLGSKRFCSKECGVEHRKRRMRKNKTKVCPICDTEFLSFSNQVLCSEECKCENRRRKARGRNAKKIQARRDALAGLKYNRLTILEFVEIRFTCTGNCAGVFVKVQCDCGTVKVVNLSSVRTGHTKSCGCLQAEMALVAGVARRGRPSHARSDLVGQIFGRWSVESFAYIHPKHNMVYYHCICECGTRRAVSGNSLAQGESKSCGCLHKEYMSKLGQKYGKVNFGNTRYYAYRDIRMRSSWEIMAAISFDRQGIKWKYEPETFKLQEDMRYTPDFYLPECNKWIEVKGYMKERSQLKIDKFIELGHNLEVWMRQEIQQEYGESVNSFMEQLKAGEIPNACMRSAS